MAKKQKEKKFDIDKEINEYEKYIKMKEEMNKDGKKHIKIYTEQGMVVQKKYIQDIKKLVEMNNVKQCEDFIKEISTDIPKFITMEEMNLYLNELVKSLDDDNKEKQKYDFRKSEYINKKLTTKQKEKIFKLEDEENKLDLELKANFQTMTEMIYPLHRLSAEKTNFLWNLTSWKFNALLTKQMNGYTKAIMLLTVLIVILTVVTTVEFFLK